MDVSNKFGYNNMAIGMYAGNSGNALYCPTGYLELLRLQDRFVYLPETAVTARSTSTRRQETFFRRSSLCLMAAKVRLQAGATA